MSIPSSVQNLDEDTIQKFRDIVKLPLKFSNEEEEKLATAAVEKLTDEELDGTARILYSYWALKLLGDDAITPEVTKKLATKVTIWHVQFLGSKDVDKIAARVKKMLACREFWKCEQYRTCFDKDATSEDQVTFKKDILEECQKQVNAFIGKDKAGRAMFITGPRVGTGFEELVFGHSQLFHSEKMVAVSEFVTDGEFDKVCAIVQHAGSTNAPPTSSNRKIMGLLQILYPARMGRAIIMNAPFLFRQFFALIKPLLPKATQNATVLVTTSDIPKELNAVLPDNETVSETGEFLKEIDMRKYVSEIPFYKPYEF